MIPKNRTLSLVCALLVLAEKPLTSEQRRELQEAGEAWVAFARRSEGPLPPHATMLEANRRLRAAGIID